MRNAPRKIFRAPEARAWAYLANALRISSDLRGAEEALDTAEEHHQRGGEDGYTGAEILSFRASLRNAQGRYEEAAALIDPLIKLYWEARDRHREGKALIQKWTSLSYAGRQASMPPWSRSISPWSSWSGALPGS